ncbi:hypothetical protein GCM10009616_37060 [Microlunatus lacustris]
MDDGGADPGLAARPSAEPTDDLPALAVALTGDPGQAARLLGEVQVAARSTAVDPRTLLVERYLRQAGPGPAPPPRLPAELAPVWARLCTLPPLPRAVLVLRLHGRLTRPEVARLLDRPGPAVGRALEEAEARVAASDLEVLAVPARLPAPDPTAVDRAARTASRRRARRRDRVLLAAALVVVLLVGSAVLPGVLRRPPFVRPHGAWVHGFDLAPGGRWTVVSRLLAPDRDGLTVARDGDQRRICTVDVISSGRPLTVPDGRRTRVAGRPATLVGGPANPYLWWAVGPQSAAVVGCVDSAPPATLLELAGRVRFREVPLLLPVDLTRLEPGLQVRLVSRGERTRVVLGLPGDVRGGSPVPLYLTVPGSDGVPEEQQRRSDVRVRGLAATLIRGRNGGLALCWPVQGSSACVSGYVFRELDDLERTELLQRVERTAEAVRFAADVTRDPTWFDGRAALPG